MNCTIAAARGGGVQWIVDALPARGADDSTLLAMLGSGALSLLVEREMRSAWWDIKESEYLGE